MDQDRTGNIKVVGTYYKDQDNYCLKGYVQSKGDALQEKKPLYSWNFYEKKQNQNWEPQQSRSLASNEKTSFHKHAGPKTQYVSKEPFHHCSEKGYADFKLKSKNHQPLELSLKAPQN